MHVKQVPLEIPLPIENDTRACRVRTRDGVIWFIRIEATSTKVFLKGVFPLILALLFVNRKAGVC
jgi:hypothetical protein